MTSNTIETGQLEPLDRPDTTRWVLRSSSESFDADVFEKSIARTKLLSQQLLRLASASTPITEATSAYVPANVLEVVHKFRAMATTMSNPSAFPTLVEPAQWQYVPEQIDHAAISELKRIWALPYRGDVDFDFRIESE
jgi:hypothetical protein